MASQRRSRRAGRPGNSIQKKRGTGVMEKRMSTTSKVARRSHRETRESQKGLEKTDGIHSSVYLNHGSDWGWFYSTLSHR